MFILRPRSFLFIVLLLSVLLVGRDSVAHASRKELRVLFIGNSLTYANDLPGIVEALAKADRLVKFEYRSIALPNFSLEDHWHKKDAVKAIEKGKWDFVVMQQGPSAGMDGRKVLLDYGKRFADEIRRNGGTPAMYMVWPSVARADDFDGVSETYRLGAEAVNGLFLPVGQAWLFALQKDRSIPLFSDDGFHPSKTGSYLAALVIYEQLSGQTPVGLPAKLSLRSGEMIDITPKQAGTLQLAAKEANERFSRRIVKPDK